MSKILEICCGDLNSLIAAKKGGAYRLELCSGLSEGGLTPSIGLIRKAANLGFTEINVLIRPRPGDFLYSEDEIKLMEEDIKAAVNAGATGIVTGCLDPDGNINKKLTARLIKAAREASSYPVNITFHRAFDVTADPMQSIEDVIALGCDCLLTSGLAKDAFTGKEMLRKLKEKAGDRIKIIAGSGISPMNAKEILAYSDIDGIHGTARQACESGMRFRRPGVPMGIPGMSEYSILTTFPDIVAELLEITTSTSRD